MTQEEASPTAQRIALAQIFPKLGDVNYNLGLHLEHIERAVASGASLIVFPELSLTGYFLRDMVPDVAITAECDQLKQLCAASEKIDIVFGGVERTPEHRFFNCGWYLHAGKLAHVHRKVYLPTYGLFDEHRYFARGDRFRPIEVPAFGRVGLLVCEDLWHLSSLAILHAHQIDLLVGIADSPLRGVASPKPATAETYERMCRTYAELLGVYVVLVNRVGFEDGLCFWGGSMLIGPDGKLVTTAPMLDEALVLGQFEPAELRRRRIISPLSRDERLLVTLEELEHAKRCRYAE